MKSRHCCKPHCFSSLLLVLFCLGNLGELLCSITTTAAASAERNKSGKSAGNLPTVPDCDREDLCQSGSFKQDQSHQLTEESRSSSGDFSDNCFCSHQQEEEEEGGKKSPPFSVGMSGLAMEEMGATAAPPTAVAPPLDDGELVPASSKPAASKDCCTHDDQDAADAAVSSGTAPNSTSGLEGEEEGERSTNLGEDDYVPQRFVVGCGGDRAEAASRWKKTLEWRKENKIDEILDTPQPRFYDCREVFPVYLHGRSRQGMPVLWERIGKVNVAKADELELPLEVLTPNYIFMNECVWRLILDKGEDKNDDAKFITVEDVSGVRPWHLTPKVLSVVRSLTGIMKAHYVERCHKTYIINAPRAFTALWRVVSAMLDPRTRAKVSILGTDYLGAIQEEVDISQIPPEYGGKSGRAVDDSDEERKIQALVARLNSAAKPEGEGGSA